MVCGKSAAANFFSIWDMNIHDKKSAASLRQKNDFLWDMNIHDRESAASLRQQISFIWNMNIHDKESAAANFFYMGYEYS